MTKLTEKSYNKLIKLITMQNCFMYQDPTASEKELNTSVKVYSTLLYGGIHHESL